MDQPDERQRREGDLGEEFEADIDDRARRGGGAGDARESDRPSPEQISADLRKRQHFGARIAHQTSPDRDPWPRPGQQRPPGDPHHRHQCEVDQANRREPRPSDGEQRTDHGVRPEIARPTRRSAPVPAIAARQRTSLTRAFPAPRPRVAPDAARLAQYRRASAESGAAADRDRSPACAAHARRGTPRQSRGT